MNKDLIIFGARAKVYLKFNDDMQSLAKRLSEDLLLPEFYFDTDQDEPHEEFGSCEALGFQLWLVSSDLIDFSYLLEIATEHSHEEIMNDRMHDLSPWLARNDLATWRTAKFGTTRRVSARSTTRSSFATGN